MKFSRILFSLAFLFPCFAGHGQSAPRHCGVDEMIQQDIQNDPSLLGKYTSTHFDVSDSMQGRAGGVITIPVIVQIVYDVPAENIPMYQINTLLILMNQNFRRTMPEAANTEDYSQWGTFPADCEIEFCLVGLNRIHTAYADFAMVPPSNTTLPSDVKNVAPGYGQGYLNIWICSLSGAINGYATMPPISNPQYDGVVIDYRYAGLWGTSDMNYAGKVMIHELGHWFGLEHTWGNGPTGQVWDPVNQMWATQCGDDYVADTWQQHTPGYGSTYIITNCQGSLFYPQNYHSMYQNYMDYTVAGWMNFFSEGQKTRMWYHINTFRPYLVNAPIPCTTGFDDPDPNALCNAWYDESTRALVMEPSPDFTGSAILEVRDISGREVMRTGLDLYANQITRSELPADLAKGMYIATISNTDKRVVLKFILE